jgi:hypothetical protein
MILEDDDRFFSFYIVHRLSFFLFFFKMVCSVGNFNSLEVFMYLRDIIIQTTNFIIITSQRDANFIMNVIKFTVTKIKRCPL